MDFIRRDREEDGGRRKQETGNRKQELQLRTATANCDCELLWSRRGSCDADMLQSLGCMTRSSS
jgi:hypothetical protein